MQPAARRLFYTDGFKKAGKVPGKVIRLVDKFCESLWKVRLSITRALSFKNSHSMYCIIYDSLLEN